jgi:ParB family chromosome partitioning protein
MSTSPHQSVQFQTIPLIRINLHDDTFRITTRENVDDLVASIQVCGLITPPTVIRMASGYGIVSGFRRIRACQKAGHDEIIARILGPETGRLACLRLAIAENALQRPLNLIETSRALQKLSKMSTGMQQLTDIAFSCGLPTNPDVIRKIKELCLLPEPIQQGVLNDTIQLAMAGELAMLPDDAAILMVRLFEKLKLSLSRQRETIALVTEIARCQDMSIRQVLSHETFLRIADDDELDRVRKTRQIRDFLRQWRYPRIVEAEHHYLLNVKKLKLGQDLKLIPPKDFEGSSYSLVLNFDSIAQLKLLHKKINRILQHPSLVEIIDD